MYQPDLLDISMDVFGGYTPAIPPANLPAGGAGIAQDVMYPQGGLRTRGGLQSVFANQMPGNASVNGLKSYLTPSLQQRLMVWDSLGNLYKENPQGTINLVASRPYANLFYQSSTIFGREYQAYFNSAGGFDIPRQFDDTNWDRVSQCGPGAAPNAADETGAFNIVAATGAQNLAGPTVASPNGLTESGNIVTVTMAGPVTGLKSGDQVIITGAANAGYNGTFRILNVVSTTVFTLVNAITGLPGDGAVGASGISLSIGVFFTTAANPYVVGELVTVAGVGVAGYNGTWKVQQIVSNTEFTVDLGVAGLATSGGGTASFGGSVSSGLHQISVAFITRQGFITAAAVPNSFVASGNKRVVVVNIPVGPPNIIARLLMFTPSISAPAVTGNFFSLPNGSNQIFTSTMLVNDNVTTTTTVDFSDTVLQAGFSCNYLFTQIELGECSFTAGYNARGVWMGERSKVNNVVNFTFDGGFGTDASARKFPLGWTEDPTNYAGGGSALTGGFTADWGDAYSITGDGATAIRGKITQTAYKDYLGVSIIGSAQAYSVRFRAARNNTLAQGTLHFNVQSTIGGFTTTGLSVTAAQLTTQYQEFTATLDGINTPQNIDLQFQLYADGTPTNGGVFLVDSIEVFPTLTPFNYSIARFSHAFNPESFDSITGQITVRSNDGQRLQAAFPIRNALYLAKDHYLAYVQDDGVNEPATWAGGVTEVSSTIGICGPNAWDGVEEWAVFAERSGAYICWGSDPVKISQEIQTDASGMGKITWSSINWSAAYTIWIRIDRVNKMILIGAPVNGATSPNVIFMLDYQWLENGQDIASSPMVTYSAFTGKILAHGRGRRWALWSITANCMTFAERTDGTAQPFFGNGTANGKIYQQFDCAVQTSDDGAAIPWNYQGYGCPSIIEEQQLQLSAHRKLLGYIKFRAIGVGLMGLAISTAQRSTILRSYNLSLSPAGDGERPVNVHGERFFMTIRQNSVPGYWMQCEKQVFCLRKDAMIPVRGVSS